MRVRASISPRPHDAEASCSDRLHSSTRSSLLLVLQFRAIRENCNIFRRKNFPPPLEFLRSLLFVDPISRICFAIGQRMGSRSTGLGISGSRFPSLWTLVIRCPIPAPRPLACIVGCNCLIRGWWSSTVLTLTANWYFVPSGTTIAMVVRNHWKAYELGMFPRQEGPPSSKS